MKLWTHPIDLATCPRLPATGHQHLPGWVPGRATGHVSMSEQMSEMRLDTVGDECMNCDIHLDILTVTWLTMTLRNMY